MQILLIRHSETVLSKTIPNAQWILSTKGINFAEKMAMNPELQKCSKIYASFQTKALETALILAKPNRIALAAYEDLTETSSVTNGFFENFETEMHNWHEKSDYRINAGETKSEALTRFSKAIARIISENKDDARVAVVSHGNVLSCFSEIYLHEKSFELHSRMKMPDMALFDTTSKKFISHWGTIS